MVASEKPLVSILIPCFNAESFIGTALQSLLEQTWTNLEIIVVDDGSSDRSAEVVASFGDSRIRLIRQENKGQSAAANVAWAQSSGRLIKFFDADDILGRDMIELQVDRIDGRDDAVAMGEWARFYGDEPTVTDFKPRPMYRDAKPVDWLVAEWEFARPMMQCALWLIPRSILEKSGAWNEKLSLINDFEFFARVLTSASDILYTPGARLFYRSGIPGSLSGRKSRTAIESALLSVRLGTDRLLQRENSVRTRRVSANLFQDFIYSTYPEHPDLVAEAAAMVESLGGANLSPDGPPGFHRARSLLGWRAARRLQRWKERWRSPLATF